ncbi:NAD(P)H-binding protein [Kitasatospora sp. NPDC057015]|uniref:NAD(P)H-binding protein n=1 Tax=Kitasatospora sp. NPDC057015 TaxID=3346001 RepID=UPI00363D9F87
MSGHRKVLVTGATGAVGRLVVAQLLEAGSAVRALARDPATAALPDGVEVVRGDLSDPGTVPTALDGVDGVFLVWPFAGVEGLTEVLAAVAGRARRLVYLSSAAVRDHERRAERLIARSGLEWTVLRPHAFAANALSWAEGIRSGAVVREPYGAAAAPVVHEGDIAAVAVRALLGEGHAGAIHELTGPESLTRAEQARIIGEVIGRPVRWEEATVGEARQRMSARGWPAEAVDGVLRAQAGAVTDPLPPTDTVERVTGAPARTFRRWVTDHADAYRAPVTAEALRAPMTAVRIHGYGPVDVIRSEVVPRPVPGPGEVLVRVAATSFNPSETALRAGRLRDVLAVPLPYTLGWDVSGTVVEVGGDVRGFAVGDRVLGRLDGGGAAAEYVAAPVGVLAKAPASVDPAVAAAIPVAGLTAWQALFDHARVTAGQRVFVNGAGGGVGLFAVQLAKHVGATVVATASGRSRAAVRAHGADLIVDYTTTPLGDALGGPVDAVVNLAAITPESAAGLVRLVRPGGVVVSIATPVEPPADGSVGAVHVIARNDVAQLTAIVGLVDAGRLALDAVEVRPLADLPLVHRESEAGRTHGKIVLRV